jgi:PAP_fibrillin
VYPKTKMRCTLWTLALPTAACLSLVETRHKSCTGYWSASSSRQLAATTTHSSEQRSWTLRAASRSGSSSSETNTVEDLRDELLALVRDAPTGRATPPSLTARILDRVRMLEQGNCPTDNASVPSSLAGTWELLWTAQDPLAPESQRLWSSWINPLENQSYSNNPQAAASGQANPFLPLALQTRLQQLGILDATPDTTSTSFAPPPVRSTQSIDVKSGLIRNVVAVNVGKDRTAALTVTIRFATDATDLRRVHVKFESCRVVVPQTPIDWDIRLGILGPTGWLRTVYIDDAVRITRGHKGSVFILSRPGRA